MEVISTLVFSRKALNNTARSATTEQPCQLQHLDTHQGPLLCLSKPG